MADSRPSRRFRVARRAVRAIAGGVALALAFLSAAPAAAASSAAVSVSATILPKSNCKFITGAATLAFGHLVPGNPDVSVSTTLAFRCNGGPPTTLFVVTDDDGLDETGPDAGRMRHALLPGTYLPYSFTVAPLSANVPRNTPQTLTVTGTVKGLDYQASVPGDYSDTVTVSINP